MDDVARAGLVKFDFLGLNTLTMLAHAEKSLRESGRFPGLQVGRHPAGRRGDF